MPFFVYPLPYAVGAYFMYALPYAVGAAPRARPQFS